MATWILIAAFIVSFAISAAAVWGYVCIAPHLKLVDKPDGRRKIHVKPTPVSGGIAIFVAALATILLMACCVPQVQVVIANHYGEVLGIASAAFILTVIGVFDDRYHLPGKLKLLVQIIVAFIAVYSGASFEKISLFGYSVALGWLAVPFAIFWLVGSINAINLLDGLDGMASTVCLALFLTVGIIAIFHNQTFEISFLSFVLSGSLLGFLVYNFPPAKIFLGDSGSMLLGLMAGWLAIMASSKTHTLLILLPVAIMTLPILDSAAAMLRRKLTGRSIFDTDRNHIHHRLMLKFDCNQKVLFVVCILSCGLSASVLLGVFLKQDWIAFAGSVTAILLMAITDTFGRNEIQLLAKRFTLFRQQKTASELSPCSLVTFRLQGKANWNSLWDDLLASAQSMGAISLHLDISISSVHEEFVASWESNAKSHQRHRWGIKIPLVIESQSYGKITLGFEDAEDTSRNYLQEIHELLPLCMKSILAEVEQLTPNEQSAPQKSDISHSHSQASYQTPPT